MPHDPSPRLARALGYADRIAAGGTPPGVLEGVDDAVVVTDALLNKPGPTITYVNAAFETLTGYDRTELLGRSPRMLQGFDTDPRELARMKATLVRGDVFEGAVLNYTKTGIEYVVGWAVVPVRDAGGRICQWLSIQNDVLADKRADRRPGATSG